MVVMKKHGSNKENISQAVLRLGTKLWWLRAPITFLHVTIGIELRTLLPESNALTTRPMRQPLKFETMWDLITIPPPLKPIMERQTLTYSGEGSNCRDSMDPPYPTCMTVLYNRLL